MKKMKQCEFCAKKFRNRKNMVSHMWGAHAFWYATRRMMAVAMPKEGKSVDRLHPNDVPPVIKTAREGKPQRRIRMMMNAARVKKQHDAATKKGIIAKKQRDKAAAERARVRRRANGV